MIKTRQKIYKKPENKKYFGPKVIDHKGDLEKEIEESLAVVKSPEFKKMALEVGDKESMELLMKQEFCITENFLIILRREKRIINTL